MRCRPVRVLVDDRKGGAGKIPIAGPPQCGWPRRRPTGVVDDFVSCG